MAVKFSNNAKTTLSSGITSSATSIAVVDASAWPTLGSGDHTLCTFIDGADADVLEIVKVTAISGNTLTVVRAQEGTTARAFASADKAELRITAGLLEQALTGTDVVKLDSLTASATASYSMAVSGVAYSPSNVNALIVSLNGVTQEPTEAFTISGSTLTFASALTSADSIDYIVDLAKTLDIGEPSDNTVSPAKLTSAVNLDAITDNGATTTNAVTVGNLTSTGIDDNATSTAITISSAQNVTFAGEIDASESRFFKPAGFWGANTAFFGHNYGSLASQGSFDLHLTANGYRNSSGTWTSLGVNSQAGASQIALGADGKIEFNAEATKNTGDSHAVTTRMTLTNDGMLGVGETSPAARIHSKTTTQTLALLETTNSTRGILFLKDANTTGNTHVGIGAVGNDLQLFSGGSTARVTINNTGTVGIGTAAPAQRQLYVQEPGTGYGGAITAATATAAGNAGYRYDTAGVTRWATSLIGTAGSEDLRFLKDGSSEKLRITAAGKVGIGTSPAEDLHVASSGGSTLRLENSTASLAQNSELGAIEFYTNDASNAGVGVAASIRSPVIGSTGGQGSLAFSVASGTTNDEEVMRINSSGVGIGEIAPVALLHVKATEGSTGETDPLARFERFTSGDNAYLDITVNNSTNMIGFQSTGTSNGGFTFGGATADLVTITSAGNVGIGNGTQGIVNSAGYKTITLGGDDGAQMLFRQSNVSEGFLYSKAGSLDIGALGDFHISSGSTGGDAGRKMTLDSAGKLALTANSGGLQLRTGTSTQDAYIDWQFNSTTANYIRMGIDYDTRASTGWMVDSGYPITLDYTTSLVFKASGTEKARLDVNGHLLVGRSSTGVSATDHGSNIYNNGQIYSYTSSSGTDDMYRLYNSAGTKAYSIKANGTVYSVSDRVLKENIIDSESALAIVNDIKVRSFDWREDGDHVSHGFIAQELNEAYPEAASEPLEDQVHWSVDYTRLVPVLTKAIQDQQAIIEDLQTRLSALEAN